MISLKTRVIAMAVMTAFGTGLSQGAVVNEGYSEFINVGDHAVADGVAQDGKYPRKTYYKDRHYVIPEGLEIGAYYATWGGYPGRDYKAHQVPVERLNTIYVAFAGICGENPGAYQGGAGLRTSCTSIHAAANGPFYFPTIDKLQDGEVSFIDDNWGLLDKAWEGGKDPQNQLAGMMDWKRRNPNLKVIWSIGGWSYSRPFYEMISSSATRAKFVNSLALWLSQPAMGFVDGVDVDFEFPGGLGLDAGKGNPQDGANYLELIKDMRAKLDELARQNGHKRYELTTAIGVGPNQLKNWGMSSRIGDMIPYLDRLGLMTYDFSGAFSDQVGFNTALGVPQGDQGKGQVNIKTVIETLKRDHGVTDEHLKKTALGVGFYGRSHGSVANVEPAALPGTRSSGSGGGGTVEEGVYSFFDLYSNYIGSEGKGINGWKVYSYPEYGGSLLYNASKQQAINFSSPDDITALTKYAKKMGMKGVFSWQIDDDNGMLLEAVHRAYGHQLATMQPGKPVVYAPDCKTMLGSSKIQLKPGMSFSSDGQVYTLAGWGSKCPNEGEAWERNSWKLLGSASDMQIVGAKPGSGVNQAGANSQPPATPVANSQPAATPVVNTPPAATPVVNTQPPASPVATTQPPASPVVNTQPPASQVVTTQPPATPVVNTQPGSNWEAGKVYPSKGSKVVHKGITWESQWWTNGEPGVDAAWKDVTPEVAGNTAAWSAGKTYEKTGSIVTHKGATWRSKWWTNGEPGVDAAWENTTQQPAGTTATWQQGKVYDKAGSTVTHNGVAWKSKWWTNGEPGVDAAWERN